MFEASNRIIQIVPCKTALTDALKNLDLNNENFMYLKEHYCQLQTNNPASMNKQSAKAIMVRSRLRNRVFFVEWTKLLQKAKNLSRY